MWFLQFLPHWIFYVILILGIIGFVAQRFIPSYYKTLVFSISLLSLVFGLFMLGAIYENKSWVAKVKEMELKIAEAETKSQSENVKIVEKIIYQDRIIKQKGQDIVKYIDREIVKYDNQCVIPSEVINVLNDASTLKK